MAKVRATRIHRCAPLETLNWQSATLEQASPATLELLFQHQAQHCYLNQSLTQWFLRRFHDLHNLYHRHDHGITLKSSINSCTTTKESVSTTLVPSSWWGDQIMTFLSNLTTSAEEPSTVGNVFQQVMTIVFRDRITPLYEVLHRHPRHLGPPFELCSFISGVPPPSNASLIPDHDWLYLLAIPDVATVDWLINHGYPWRDTENILLSISYRKGQTRYNELCWLIHYPPPIDMKDRGCFIKLYQRFLLPWTDNEVRCSTYFERQPLSHECIKLLSIVAVRHGDYETLMLLRSLGYRVEGSGVPALLDQVSTIVQTMYKLCQTLPFELTSIIEAYFRIDYDIVTRTQQAKRPSLTTRELSFPL